MHCQESRQAGNWQRRIAGALPEQTTRGRAPCWTHSIPTRYNDCNMTVVQTEAATSARARTEGFAPFFVLPRECERPNDFREDVYLYQAVLSPFGELGLG